MSMWVLVCRGFHPLGVTWPLRGVPVKACLDVPFRLVKDSVWMWILTLSDNSFLWCGIAIFIKKHSVLMRETAEDFGDNSGMSPRYVFIVSFHICLSQLWANEKMRRLTEKQSCGSVIILNAGDVWRPSYDLLRELVVTWRHSCPYHQWAGLPSGAATSQTWSNCKHTRNSLLRGAVGPSLRHTPRPFFLIDLSSLRSIFSASLLTLRLSTGHLSSFIACWVLDIFIFF